MSASAADTPKVTRLGLPATVVFAQSSAGSGALTGFQVAHAATDGDESPPQLTPQQVHSTVCFPATPVSLICQAEYARCSNR